MDQRILFLWMLLFVFGWFVVVFSVPTLPLTGQFTVKIAAFDNVDEQQSQNPILIHQEYLYNIDLSGFSHIERETKREGFFIPPEGEFIPTEEGFDEKFSSIQPQDHFELKEDLFLLDVFRSLYTASELSDSPKQRTDPSRTMLETVGRITGIGGGGTTSNAGGNVIIGKGCTTAYDIDWDCDGYGVGPNILPDADDTDAQVNTPQTVVTKYGDPLQDINNLRKFFAARGYTVGDMWFVDPVNGENPPRDKSKIDARKNDIRNPFKSTSPLVWTNYNRWNTVKPGDAVIFRQSTIDQLRLLDRDPDPDTYISGAPGKPVLVIAYPGEELLINGKQDAFNTGPTGDYVIYDGFVVRSDSGKGNPAGIELVGSDFVEIRNMEISNYKWGIHSNLEPENNDILIERVVAHSAHDQHGMYFSSRKASGRGHHRITVKDSLIYRNAWHGIQTNGFVDTFRFENNIIHSNGFGGFSLINGHRHSIFRNNLIFNNIRDAVIMTTYWHDQVPFETRSNNNNTFENNLFWIGRDQNGKQTGTDRPSWHTAILFKDNYPNFNFVRTVNGKQITFPGIEFQFVDNRFNNNIIVTQGSVNTGGSVIFNSFQPIHVPFTHFHNNVFYMSGRDEVLVTNHGTDNSHDWSRRDTSGLWYFYWRLSGVEKHAVLKNNFVGNKILDPQFTDVKFSYALTPHQFNFLPTSTSPSTNFGKRGLYTPLDDLRGFLRDATPDAGVYEFGAGGNNLLLTGRDPTGPIINNQDRPVKLFGTNFKSNAIVKLNGITHPSTYVSPTRIDITIPKGFNAGMYQATVTVDQKTSNPLSIDVRDPQSPPTLTRRNPSGPIINDQNRLVQFFGTSFNPQAVLKLNGVTHPSTYVSPTQIDITIPKDFKAGLYDTTVSVGTLTSNALQLEVRDPPKSPPELISLSKGRVINDIEESVSLFGKNFETVSEVLINNNPYFPHLTHYKSPTQIDITVQKGTPPADYPLSIRNSDKQTSATKILEVRQPANISGLLPKGELSEKTKQVTLRVTTDVPAVCKYSDKPGTPYQSMPTTFSSVNKEDHTSSLSVSFGTTYDFYVRCETDSEKIVNSIDAKISFSVAKVKFSTSKFKGLTNINRLDPRNLRDVILEQIQFGGIVYPVALTGSFSVLRSINLDNFIDVTNGTIILNGTGLPEFNRPAHLYYYSTGRERPYLLRDGEVCPQTICQFLNSWSVGGRDYIQYKVTGFSNYTLGESCVDLDSDTYANNSALSCGGPNNFDCNDLNSSIHPGAPEVCGNNVDDNCDGNIDENCQCSPSGINMTCGHSNTGICRLGNQTCQLNNTWGSCQGAILPQTEICGNGIDENCDGKDDTCPTACQDKDGDNYNITLLGNQSCGPVDCNDNNKDIYPGAKEICGNGIDEDCSGQDLKCSGNKNNKGGGGSSNSGSGGGGSSFVCRTGENRSCGSSVGECTFGTQTCSNNKWGPCQGGTQPTKEICDGKDNDCNARIDDGNVCSECKSGETKICGSSIGTCKEGTQHCVNGKWGDCEGGVLPQPTDICHNGLDDNCNGEIDESCEAPNHCSNFVQDENEEGIDCGGSCPACFIYIDHTITLFYALFVVIGGLLVAGYLFVRK